MFFKVVNDQTISKPQATRSLIVWESYEYVGAGFCRPSGCDVASSSCRVNGFWKDNSNENECMNACENAAECVGYAFSNSGNSNAPNTCYVYGSSCINTPSGWNNFEYSNYEIVRSSGQQNVQCYRTFTTTSNTLFYCTIAPHTRTL